ncbi:MAG TPA: DUF3185 family protein [bacterium]|nr:DUF3185 family protein [bacterium]
MPIKRLIGVALIVVGAIVAWQGWEAYQSFGVRLGRALGSTPTNAYMMLAIGAVLAGAGVVLAARG